MENFINLFEISVKKNWNNVAITDFSSARNITYQELAEDICAYQRIWKNIGLEKGDKVVLVANNCIPWIEVYLAAVTVGYVAVILQPALSSTDLQDLIIHSDGKIIYSTKEILETLDLPALSNVMAAIDFCTNELVYINDAVASCFSAQTFTCSAECSGSFTVDSINYEKDDMDRICTFLYTSGTTGRPKGAMLSVSYFSANIHKLRQRYPHNIGDNVVCLNPFFHVFGLGGDVLPSLCSGMRIVILRALVPENIIAAMQEYKPKKVFAAPIILNRFVEMVLHPNLSENENESHYAVQKEKLIRALGGRMEVFLTGGAAISPALESFLVSKLGFPLVTAYGSTESGTVSYGIAGMHKVRSGGKIVEENKVRIDSTDPSTPGEVLIKDFLFSGYYKDPEATKEVFTKDGWFKTGDMGIIDSDNNIFITGRCKDMLLTSNGQNIYPEDIESVLNGMPYISESLLLQRGEKLHAIIVLDNKKIMSDKIEDETLLKIIDKNILEANKHLPGFAIINTYEIRKEPLERTPKGSLKRILYS